MKIADKLPVAAVCVGGAKVANIMETGLWARNGDPSVPEQVGRELSFFTQKSICGLFVALPSAHPFAHY